TQSQLPGRCGVMMAGEGGSWGESPSFRMGLLKRRVISVAWVVSPEGPPKTTARGSVVEGVPEGAAAGMEGEPRISAWGGGGRRGRGGGGAVEAARGGGEGEGEEERAAGHRGWDRMAGAMFLDPVLGAGTKNDHAKTQRRKKRHLCVFASLRDYF